MKIDGIGSVGQSWARVLTILGLVLAGCSARPSTPAADQPSGADGTTAEATRALVTIGDLRVTIDISRTANLFHWIDNLAGTSAAKTREVYRHQWLERFGPLSQEDRLALKRFRDARLHRDPPRRGYPDGSGCLPPPRPRLPLRQRLSVAVMSARDPADLLERAGRILPPRHVAALGAALDHFGPRFDTYWREVRHLEPFAADLRRFLQRDNVQVFVARLIRFYEAEIDADVPITISLIALPEEGSTHAEADGDHLLIEIRPRDRAKNQVQVVFHELSHNLARRVPADRQRALEREFYSRGAFGSMAWSLLHEGLPTALGQGVAQADLAPRGFRSDRSWYHRREIDAFARGIYDIVRRELALGRTVSERLPRRVVRWLESSPLADLPLSEHLGETALAGSEALLQGLANAERSLIAKHAWRVRWDEPQGARFLNGFECLPLVLLATQDELARMPGELSALLPELADDRLPLAPGLAGLVVPGARPSGSPVLLIVVASEIDARRGVRAVRTTRGWPRRPFEVPR
ncbi:MAG: hypothetical protein OEQ13_06560 [Acidobacteriota bacterium]|nr:hypothetical protein [Acidobacteriota bacterium]